MKLLSWNTTTFIVISEKTSNSAGINKQISCQGYSCLFFGCSIDKQIQQLEKIISAAHTHSECDRVAWSKIGVV